MLEQASWQSNHLVIHFARRILIVAQVDSLEPMGFAVRLGAHFAFRPDRASSRVLSAFQPAAMQDELIAELVANTPRAVSAVRVRADHGDGVGRGRAAGAARHRAAELGRARRARQPRLTRRPSRARMNSVQRPA